MKPLPPALREKKRYLKFRIHAEQEIKFGELVEAVWESSLGYLGSKGTGEANHWVIKNQFDRSSQKGVIKVEKSMLGDFRAALALINDFNGKKGFIEVTKISGSIKKVKDD